MWQSPELGGCPNSGRPFYSICNWTVCVQQKQIPESGMWFCLPHLHAYLKGGTFRSPLCFQHQFSHGSRESRRCSPFLHSFFSKSSNVPMFQCSRAFSLSVRRRRDFLTKDERRKTKRQIFNFAININVCYLLV